MEDKSRDEESKWKRLFAGGLAGVGLAALFWRKSKKPTKLASKAEEEKKPREEVVVDEELERQMRLLTAREEWQEQRQAQRERQQTVLPLTLVVGRLGSGKTTLCRRIVESVRDFTLGLIVNDFAQLNVDSQQLEEDIASLKESSRVKGSAVIPQVVELSNGCVCCSLQNGLAKAVEAMLSRGNSKVDYIIVETSGLTDPVEMVRIIEHELGQAVRLDSVVYMMDADNWEHVVAEEGGDRRQLSFADVVVLNKVDLLEEDGLQKDEILGALSDLTAATILPASFGEVPLERILDVVRIEPEREAFGRIVQNQTARAKMGGYSLPEKGGNLLRRAAVDQGYHSEHKVQGGLKTSWTSLVFTSEKPFSLPLLQKNVFSNPHLRERLARVKGTVYFQEQVGDRLMLQLSGRQRIDVTRVGKWLIQPSISLALVIRGDDKVATALQEALSCSTEVGQPLDNHEINMEYLRGNGNLSARSYAPGVAAVRLTGEASYGFDAEQLRVRFGVDINTVNQSFLKCLNSSGCCVLGLPSEESEEEVKTSVLVSTTEDPQAFRSALDAAVQATFRCEFSQISLCGCD